ncbi:OLC1v1012631C1 [Oldenlandia corymbosa var. corymbosa]|uniref:OLC1v1012631C1 n=1 Tax=Oldenlandia corymbosa var. corymbosa TaxID=529605 RepID=A0AAV1DYG3_OLDCO|nr:OLC1v1012631C1 [Oldenlandia corymbosa var. corymbosa]
MVNRCFKSIILGGEKLYKLRRKLGIVEYWVYFSCNSAEWEAFDTVGRKYRGLPPNSASECFKCCDMESLAVATELLVFGRDVQSLSVYKYSVVTDSWVEGVTPNTPSVVMDEKFYAIEGIGLGKKGIDGEVGNPKVLTSGEVFDMKTNVCVEIPNKLPGHIVAGVDEYALAATTSPPLLAVVKNDLYVKNHDEMLLKKYNKSLNIWTTIGRLSEKASSTNGWGLPFRGWVIYS